VSGSNLYPFRRNLFLTSTAIFFTRPSGFTKSRMFFQMFPNLFRIQIWPSSRVRDLGTALGLTKANVNVQILSPWPQSPEEELRSSLSNRNASSGGPRCSPVQNANKRMIAAAVLRRGPFDQKRDVCITGSQLLCVERVDLIRSRAPMK
jgi:hypothetical protein